GAGAVVEVLPVQALGLAILVQTAQSDGKSATAAQGVGVVGAENPAAAVKVQPVQALGLLVDPIGVQSKCKAMAAGQGVGVVGAE
ncbi:hypothetical protein VR46_45415, partial [Streptomyces sp. NRRL S-444]